MVNKRFRTSNRRVYAIGDVTGLPAFTHSASHQASLLIRHLLFRLPIKMNVDEIPRVTFTDPELAHVGLTDAQARERHGAIRVLRWPYHDNDRAQTERETRGHIKVVTNAKGLILGATIVGAAAGEQITAWTLAISQRPQHSRFCRNCRAISDLYGDRKTGGHHLLHATFDDHLGAAHFESAALVWLRSRGHAHDRTDASADGPQTAAAAARALRLGLSGKLLVLTILFVMIAEVLIYVPSIANFRLNWLNDRLAAAHTAALVLDAAPSGMVPETLARQILGSVGARAVAMKTGTQRRLLAVSDMPPKIHHDIDMRNVPWFRAIIDAFDTLLSTTRT